MAGTNPNYLAGGTIAPMVFVTPDASNDNRVTQAVHNSPIAGISSAATETAPLPSNSTNAATTGNPIRVYGEGEQCLLTYGATVTRGNRLKSDANGAGIPISGPGTLPRQQVGAIALESGIAGDIRNVQVRIYAELPSAS